MSDYEAYVPKPPKQRLEEEKQEAIRLSSSVAVIDDVMKWFEVNAEQYGSVDSLGVDESTPDTDAKVAILLSKKMKAAFEMKAQAFKSEFGAYIEKSKGGKS